MDDYKWYNDDFQNNITPEHKVASEPEFTTEPETVTEVPAKKEKKHRTVRLSALVIAIIFTAVVSVSGYALISPMISGGRVSLDSLQKDAGQVTDGTDASAVLNTGKRVLTVSEIADKVGPAVVGVVNKVKFSGYSNPFGFYFGERFPQQQEGQMIEQGSGSGVLISKDGYVVTNNHVIEGATEVTVIMNNGEEYAATVKGADSNTDLAVLKIEGNDFPYAALGSSSDLRVGELAVAIGNPLGQEFAGTVTSGIISALNRSITIDNKQLTLIQTDAAINPGNSGGPLVNQYGEVIGINTAKISSSELEGLGFAIPMDEAKPIIDDLLSSGYVRGRPVIGIGGRAVTEQDAKAYDLKVGVYVASMSPNSPAYMSGIKIGDIITEVNGKKVTTVDELNEIKNQHAVGDEITLKIWRQGDFLTIKLILGEEVPN